MKEIENKAKDNGNNMSEAKHSKKMIKAERTPQDALFIRFNVIKYDKNGRVLTDGKENKPAIGEAVITLPGTTEIESFWDEHNVFQLDETGQARLDSKGNAIRNDFSDYGGSITGYANYLRPHLKEWLSRYFREDLSEITIDELTNSICTLERKPGEFFNYLIEETLKLNTFRPVEQRS
jgi:hypothetical protein